jgi:hypothetical protein
MRVMIAARGMCRRLKPALAFMNGYPGQRSPGATLSWAKLSRPPGGSAQSTWLRWRSGDRTLAPQSQMLHASSSDGYRHYASAKGTERRDESQSPHPSQRQTPTLRPEDSCHRTTRYGVISQTTPAPSAPPIAAVPNRLPAGSIWTGP